MIGELGKELVATKFLHGLACLLIRHWLCEVEVFFTRELHASCCAFSTLSKDRSSQKEQLRKRLLDFRFKAIATEFLLLAVDVLYLATRMAPLAIECSMDRSTGYSAPEACGGSAFGAEAAEKSRLFYVTLSMAAFHALLDVVLLIATWNQNRALGYL